MKKLVLVGIVVAGITMVMVSLAHAGGGTTSVSTNSVKILANAKANASESWASTNAYTQGQLVNSGGRVWMALIAGTSGTTAPSGIVDFVDGTVTWRKSLAHKRSWLSIGNEGLTKITFSLFSPVISENGLTLDSGQKIVLIGEDCPQDAIHVISDSGTNTVSTLER